MSLHRTAAASARAAHDTYFGDPFLYIAPGGSPTQLRGNIHAERIETRPSGTGTHRVGIRSVCMTPEAIADAGITLRSDATAEIDSIAYSIEGINQTSGGRTILRLIRTLAAEVSHPGYRRR